MKTKNLLNKKITQWLLLVAMLVGCSASALAYDIYVHPSDANHKMFAWDDKSSDSWPGDQFSNTSKFDKYGTWYCWKQQPTTSNQKLIFNCGSSSCQTSNINVSSTTYYYYTGSTSYSTLSTSNKYYYSELYLDCRSFTDWTKDGAVFRAYFYSDTGCTDGEYIMTVDFSATSTTNVYKATFTCPIPIKGIKFERMKSDKTEGWNNFTINTFSSSYNCGKVTGYNAGSKTFYTACTPPTIDTHPSTTDATYCQGATATALSVTASGTVDSYQWYSYTNAACTTGETKITSATSSSYTPSTATVGTLYYKCKVTGCNTTVTSDASGAIKVKGVTINQSGDLYEYNPITFTASDIATWSLDTGSETAYISATSGISTVLKAKAGTYTVTGTKDGCDTQKQVTIVAWPNKCN